jgi:tetratricopeptide (TPR) repeat protein
MNQIFVWIAFVIAGICLAGVLYLFFSHWHEVRLIDPDSIKEEKDKHRRDALVKERFNRLKSGKVEPAKTFYKRIVFSGKTSFHRVYLRLVKLNRFYEQAKRPFSQVAPSQDDRIKVLIDEARSLARDLKWAEAEKRYLEILLMDNRNSDAYKGIGLVYLKQKLLPQAKETFDYLKKVKQADDIVYAALADIAFLEGDKRGEEAMRLKAIEVRPRLANRHAELAKFYCTHGYFKEAWPSAKRATDLDPKSARYQEIALECLIELGERIEAKRRYDKLRLITEDQPKMQKLRERIESLLPVNIEMNETGTVATDQ